MQVAVRPYVTTGIALVGASVIAVTPIAVAPPNIEKSAKAVSTAAVELAANPIDFYTEVIQRSVGNVGALAEIFLENPAPIFRQVLINQLANLEEAVDLLRQAGEGIVTAVTEEIPPLLESAFADLTSGNVEGALNTLLSVPLTLALPLLNVLGAVITPITEAVANFNRVVQDVLAGAILGGALAVAGPLISTIGSAGTAIQGVIDAVGAGDPIEVVNAVINAPGVFVDAFLNGGYGPLFLGLLPAPGFLTPEGLLGPLGAGPVGFLLAIRQAIADAITPPALATLQEAPAAEVEGTTDEVTATSSSAALTVTLDVAPEGTEDASADAVAATDPDPDAAVAAEAGEEAEEGDTATEGTEEGAEDGSTDLTDGNKVEPGDTVADDAGAGDDGTTGAGEDADTGTEAGDTDTDTGAADDADTGTDGGDSGGGDAGGDTGSGGDE